MTSPDKTTSPDKLMQDTLLLQDKIAIVYGGGGAIGGAVARAFARDGAQVHLLGRTESKLEAVAGEIRSAGGRAETGVVDVLAETAVDASVEAVVSAVGRLDVMINAAGFDDGEQGIPLVDLSAAEFGRPIADYTRSLFVTAQAAARRMKDQGSGVLLSISAPMARSGTALTGPFGPAQAAVETMTRQLAGELGGFGIRAVCLRPAGMPESAERLGSHVRQIWSRAAERVGMTLDQMLPLVAGDTMVPGPMTVGELAEVAAFLASDRARGVTGTVINVSRGAVLD